MIFCFKSDIIGIEIKQDDQALLIAIEKEESLTILVRVKTLM